MGRYNPTSLRFISMGDLANDIDRHPLVRDLALQTTLCGFCLVNGRSEGRTIFRTVCWAISVPTTLLDGVLEDGLVPLDSSALVDSQSRLLKLTPLWKSAWKEGPHSSPLAKTSFAPFPHT